MNFSRVSGDDEAREAINRSGLAPSITIAIPPSLYIHNGDDETVMVFVKKGKNSVWIITGDRNEREGVAARIRMIHDSRTD